MEQRKIMLKKTIACLFVALFLTISGSAQDVSQKQFQVSAEKIIAEIQPVLAQGVQIQVADNPPAGDQQTATSGNNSVAATSSSLRYMAASFNLGHYGPNDVMNVYYDALEDLRTQLWATLDLYDANGQRVNLPTLQLYFPKGIEKGQTGLAFRMSLYELKNFPAGEFQFRLRLSLEPGQYFFETATAMGQYLYSKTWEKGIPYLVNKYIVGQAPPADRYAVIEVLDCSDPVAIVRFADGSTLVSEPGTVPTKIVGALAVKVNLPPSSANLPILFPRLYRADIIVIDRSTGRSATYTQTLIFP